MQVYAAWWFVVLILSGAAIAVSGVEIAERSRRSIFALLSFAAIAVQSSLHQS
jgi:hypothetical protein